MLKKNRNEMIGFIMILFMINPFVAVLIIGIYYLLCVEYSRSELYAISILVAIFAGCLNATKIPDNDSLAYRDFFLSANNYSFLDYLYVWQENFQSLKEHSIKEPGYATFSYISFYLLGGNYKLFFLFFSSICYSLLNISIVKFSRAIGLSNRIAIVGVFLMTFNPLTFSISTHVFRQFLAASYLFYILIDWCLYGKKHYILLVVMFLTHTTSGLFLILLFLPWLKIRIKIKYVFLWVGLLGFLYIIPRIAINYVGVIDISFIDYVFQRASMQNATELKELSFSKLLYSFFSCFVILFLAYINKNKKTEKGLNLFAHLFLILFLFLLIFKDITYISSRFNYYCWLLFPFAMMVCLRYSKMLKLLSPVIIIFSLFLTIYHMQYLSVWKYSITNEFLYFPLLNYIL